jgi:hypothetical protein
MVWPKLDTNRPKVGSSYLAHMPLVLVHLRLVNLWHWLFWCATKFPQTWLISSLLPSASTSLSSHEHLLILEISSWSSCYKSPSPCAMLVLLTNPIIQICIDLGSLKFSSIKILGSTKSELACYSCSFAHALVIGPTRISLDLCIIIIIRRRINCSGLGMSS